MENYLLFTLIATVTILSPGPGVLLTLTNSIRYGFFGAIGGIVGIAFGTFIVAGLSATSVGVILATSAMAFMVMKYIGAAYLIYLGIKLWRSPITKLDTSSRTAGNIKVQFLEGLTIQLTNPKAVFFFMSIFPQFVDFSSSQYVSKFLMLVVTYSSLNLLIHFLYAYLARSARNWLSTEKGGRIVNRAGGGIFVLFGIGLASTTK
jgi:threonine/homoserine/homoserine lactone efflux protein